MSVVPLFRVIGKPGTTVVPHFPVTGKQGTTRIIEKFVTGNWGTPQKTGKVAKKKWVHRVVPCFPMPPNRGTTPFYLFFPEKFFRKVRFARLFAARKRYNTVVPHFLVIGKQGTMRCTQLFVTGK